MKKQRNRPTGNLANSSSAKRLSQYRATAEKFATGKNAQYFLGRTWRDYRYSSPCTAHGPAYRTSENGRKWYADQFELIGAVVWRQSDKGIGRYSTTGYYCDNDQCETVSGVVVRINTPRGRLYMAGIEWSDRDGVTLYPFNRCLVEKRKGRDGENDHTSAINDVASWADNAAEKQAEKDREYHAKDRADQDIEQAKETAHELRTNVRALLAELRTLAAPLSPAICAAVRVSVRSKLQELEEQRAIIAARQYDFWSAVNG